MSTLADVMAVVAVAGMAALLLTGRLVAARTHEAIRYDLDRTRRELRETHELNHFARAAVPVTHDEHEVVPVETGGEVVAHLCVTCDKQLPADYSEPHPSAAPRRLADGSGWDDE